MASSSTFAVILVFVALGAVLAVEAAGRPTGTLQGWNGAGVHDQDQDDSSSSSLERLSIPGAVSGFMVSPLDADRTAKYLKQINDNTLSAHSKEFCKQAKLQCNADIAIVDPTLRISRSSLADQELFQQTRDLVDATRAMQFDRNDINKDSEIALPLNLRDSNPAVSFLPQSLAEKMPFSSAKMPELFEKLSIPHDSNLAIMMSRTVGQCEAQELQGKDTHKCVTSLEAMKTFVSSSLPQDKRIVAIERSSSSSSSIPGAGESRTNKAGNKASSTTTTGSWKVLDTKLYDRAVVCRNAVFPYAVFECRDTAKSTSSSMHIYQVDMQSRTDGSRIREVAACHEGTSVHADAGTTMPDQNNNNNGNNNGNNAIKSAQACHWLTDSLIWAPQAN